MTAKQYKSARTARGTQAKVAKALGISRITISRRETGASEITHEAEIALLSIKIKHK